MYWKNLAAMMCSAALASAVAGCAAEDDPVDTGDDTTADATTTGDGDAMATGDGDGDEPTGFSYQTTSNIGDFATWTLENGQLTATWQDISVAGDVEKTYQLSGVCGTPNADFGHLTCLVDGDSVCTDGVLACQPGDGPQDGETIRLFEIPGVALMVATPNSELHAGFSAGDCADVTTDDYSFVNLGHGQRDVFGLFRTNTEFSNAAHIDFGFTAEPDNQLAYITSDEGGIVPSITASECVDGVRDLTIDATGDTLRVVITAAGHLVLDKPEGQGGLLALSSVNAATITDFADKQWGGVAFPDDSEPQLIAVTSGSLTDGKVPFVSITVEDEGEISPEVPPMLHSGATAPKLNEEMVDLNGSYASNTIVFNGDYANGAPDIPGVFELDPVTGDETAIIAVGATIDGKTLMFGAVVNGLEDNENGVRGNFILFEK